jgi:hypothetical protein
MGFPANETSGFPGRRLDPYRAGITISTFAELMFRLPTQFPSNFYCNFPPLASPGFFIEFA